MGIEWIFGVDMLCLKEWSQDAITRNNISHIHSSKNEKLNSQLILVCVYNAYWDFYISMVSNVATPSKWQITRNKADVDGHEVRQ